MIFPQPLFPLKLYSSLSQKYQIQCVYVYCRITHLLKHSFLQNLRTPYIYISSNLYKDLFQEPLSINENNFQAELIKEMSK